MLTKAGILYNIHFGNEYAKSATSLYLEILNIAVMFIRVTLACTSKTDSFLKVTFKGLKQQCWPCGCHPAHD